MRKKKNETNGAAEKRIAALKTADAINAIEGVPISQYAKELSEKWARGELTEEQIKAALNEYHRSVAKAII